MYKSIIELAKSKKWNEIIATDNPALNEAIKLEEVGLIGPIVNGDYDLALRRAVFAKKWTIIDLLLPHVKNINAMNSNQKQQTVLHFAAKHGKTDVVKKLLQMGAYPDIYDDENDTPLHFAYEFKHSDTA